MGTKSTWVALALGVALSLPVLGIGLHDDDFFHRLALSGKLPDFQRDSWSLYEFLRTPAETQHMIDVGLVPWFTDPELRTRFFRPLTSALLALDVRLFGDWALPAYLHSLFWFALVLLLVVHVQRVLLPQRAAFFATLTYAVAGPHAGTTSWIAARHVLLSGVFGLAAFALSLARRDSTRRSALGCGLGTAALLGVGLLASEATLAVLPLLLGELWLGFRGTTRERWLRGGPAVAVSLVYLGFYAASGYGTQRMGSYVSPFETPGRFVLAALDRLPLLLTEIFLGAPCALARLSPVVHGAYWALGIASALAVVLLFRRSAPDPSLRWLPLALFGALLPFAGPILDGRVLLMPLVASSMLVGVVVANRGSHVPRWAGNTLLVFGLGISPLVRVGIALATGNISRIESQIVERSQIRCPSGSRVFVVNGADPAIGLYSGPLFALSGASFSGFHVLSLAPSDLELERRSARSFVLRTPGERRSNEFESLYRRSAPEAGLRVSTRNLRVEVEQSSEQGATAVHFELDTELDSSCLVRWKGGAEGHFESFTLPSTGVLKLLHEPGPLGI